MAYNRPSIETYETEPEASTVASRLVVTCRVRWADAVRVQTTDGRAWVVLTECGYFRKDGSIQ